MTEWLPRKVAFIGSSCVGKTALLEVCKTTYAGCAEVVFVEEAARDFFRENRVKDRFSAAAQGKIQMMALARERRAHASGAAAIVCDRSVLDAVVYTYARGDAVGAMKLLDRVRFWLPTYQSLLLLDPRDIAYQTDAVRTESVAVRQQFHEAFIGFFDETGIPYRLLSGTIARRMAQVDDIIEAPLLAG
jgi:nicotinamide riboside kinase